MRKFILNFNCVPCLERTALCACVCVYLERWCTLRVIESKSGVQSLGCGAGGGWHVSPVASDNDMIY